MSSSSTFTVGDVLDWTSGRLVNSDAIGAGVSSIRVRGVAPLNQAESEDIAFFFSKAYQDQLLSAHPGIMITGEPFVIPLQESGLPLWKESAIIACRDPYYAMALISKHLAVGHSTSAPDMSASLGNASIHPSAIVHDSVELGEGVVIGPNVVIEAGSRIGDRTRILAGTYVGANCEIGSECLLFPNVVIYEQVRMGHRVRIHSGTVIGADGFGYAPKMNEDGKVLSHEKIYHLGRVQIGDDVEIGANSCVDRGTMGDTVIEDLVKIDNQVQIGHNCHVEKGSVICGSAGLAGRAHIGKFAYIGGLAGISNAVYVGDGAKVGAMSLISKDVPAGGTVIGNPQREYREHFKAHAALNSLVKGKKRGR